MNKHIDVDMLVTELSSELLPEIVEEIAELIGMDKTMLLIRDFGGRDYRVPVGVNDSERQQELIKTLGEDTAREFMAVYGNDRVYIPKCEMAYREVRNLTFIADVDNAVTGGMSKTRAVQKLAGKYGLSERWAFQVLKDRSCYLSGCLNEQDDLFGVSYE